MKETKIRSILPILILFLLFLSTISIEGVEGDPIETNIIERHETEEWKNEEIIIDESLVIRGSLLIENSEIYIKSSVGGEIIIEDGGTMRVIDSFIQPYFKRYHNSISLELDEGQNLLSFPFHREDDSIRKVMSPLEGHYDSVWYFDREEGWLTFRPERERNNLENVTQYMGVVVNITDQITLEMEGFSPELFEIELQEGENWVSYPGSEKKTVGTVFYDIMDHVESVSTKIAGEDVVLHENETMTPGRGYWVKVSQDCLWEYRPDLGVDEKDALGFEKDRGTTIHFEPGSSGTIRDSTLKGLGDSQEHPGFVIESDEVSIYGSEFKENYVDITVREASPDIMHSNFKNSRAGSIDSSYSSFNAQNNKFQRSDGYSFNILGGAPTLSENEIIDNQGIQLIDSNAHIFSNKISNTVEKGISIHEGTPLIEENSFVSNPTALKTAESNVTISHNTFSDNLIGIHGENGSPMIEHNLFNEDRTSIYIQEGSGRIIRNEIRNVDRWGIDIEDSLDLSIIDNRILDGSLGIRLSGEGNRVEKNLIRNCIDGGALVRGSSDIKFITNTIRGISGTGLTVEDSDGIFYDNRIDDSRRGVNLKADVTFIENTVSNNDDGINVKGSSPYFDGNIISNNEDYGFRFEESSAIIRRASILNSRYHLYLVSSDVRIVDSAFREDRVFADDGSDLTIEDTLNASMDEGSTLSYDIYEDLPPSSEITGVYRTGPIEVDIRHDSVYFVPEDYYWGTVNMTFNVTIAEEFETEVPFTLEVEPVNNPPILRNKTVSVSYEPTRVRWEVIYEDKDGYTPTSIELVVDGDHYQMREYNESHQDAFDGKRYYYEMYLEPGEYTYYIKATENNPLGANHTINTQYYDLEISPPTPGWFGLSNQEMASIGTIFMFIVLVILLVKNRKDSSDDETESFRDEETDREEMFKELPILTKKGDTDKKTSKGSTKKLPVLKKREETKGSKEKGTVKASRKNRLVKEIEEEEPEEVEQDVEEETEIEDKEEERSKKQRIVKTKKRIRPKSRVIKESDQENNGKLKRVIKEN